MVDCYPSPFRPPRSFLGRRDLPLGAEWWDGTTTTLLTLLPPCLSVHELFWTKPFFLEQVLRPLFPTRVNSFLAITPFLAFGGTHSPSPSRDGTGTVFPLISFFLLSTSFSHWAFSQEVLGVTGFLSDAGRPLVDFLTFYFCRPLAR